MKSALALLVLASSAADAQTNDELKQRLHRLDSLAVVRLQELRESFGAEYEGQHLQALEVDGVRLLADSAIATIAAEGFRLGLQDVRARGTEWAAQIVSGLELRIVNDFNSFAGSDDRKIVAYDQDNPALSASVPVLRRDAAGVRHATTALFDRLLQNILDVEFKSWLAPVLQGASTRSLRVTSVTEDNSIFAAAHERSHLWSAVRMHALRTPAAASRDCLGGSVPACASAIGLGAGAREPLSAWYAPSDYKWLTDHVSPEGDSLRREDHVACNRGSIAACERYVATTPPGKVDAPLALAEIRRSLLVLALSTGGPDAASRLLASTGPIPARLATVAGIPFDALLATWQRRVAAAPAMPPRLHPFALITGILGAMTLLTIPRRRG